MSEKTLGNQYTTQLTFTLLTVHSLEQEQSKSVRDSAWVTCYRPCAGKATYAALRWDSSLEIMVFAIRIDGGFHLFSIATLATVKQKS